MDGEGVPKKSGRGRGRGRGRGGAGSRGSRGGGGTGRGRGRPKSSSTTSGGGQRGRPKKMVIESDEEEQIIETSEIVDNQVEISDDDDHDDEMVIDERENLNPSVESVPETKAEPEESNKAKSEEPSEKVEFNIDDDISQLVPPTFSTVSKGPPQPMLELTWEHKYTAIGDKLPTPNVHMCSGCKLPIRIYGRLIPCKHVCCLSCAKKQTHCSCCSDRVSRVEQAQLGQVFMCHHGGTRYGFDGCRRTYLSQRDLQAHVNHRHKPRNAASESSRNDSYHANTSGSASGSNYDHGNSNSSSHYNRQNAPAHYSTGRGGGESGGSSTPGSRYERKSSFTRNSSWSSSYNNRPY